MIADLPSSSVDRLQNLSSMPSAIMISVDEMETLQDAYQLLQTFSNTQYVKVHGKTSPRQNIEKYIIQFFHCCAVRKWPVLIETGNHPSPDRTIVLSLMSTFNNASGERTLQQIHTSLANACTFQEIDCASSPSIAFLSSALWLVVLSLCVPY